jgi:hypothetical protein
MRQIDELEQALTGFVQDHHRLMLGYIWSTLIISTPDCSTRGGYEQAVAPFDETRGWRLTGFRGSVRHGTHFAELGVDMSRFASAGHAASWAGLTPEKQAQAKLFQQDCQR